MEQIIKKCKVLGCKEPSTLTGYCKEHQADRDRTNRILEELEQNDEVEDLD